METRPECGAEITSEMNCQVMFDECLAKEFADPGFGAVHHLTVATFMLQHSSKLSRDGWLATRQLLRDFLIDHKSPALLRRLNKHFVDIRKRQWNITSRDGQTIILRNTWTKTIVAVRPQDSVSYCTDVTVWARAALEDSQTVSLLPKNADSNLEQGKI